MATASLGAASCPPTSIIGPAVYPATSNSRRVRSNSEISHGSQSPRLTIKSIIHSTSFRNPNPNIPPFPTPSPVRSTETKRSGREHYKRLKEREVRNLPFLHLLQPPGSHFRFLMPLFPRREQVEPGNTRPHMGILSPFCPSHR